MKVLQLTQYLAVGGLEKCVTNIAIGLGSKGYPSLVAAYEKEAVCPDFVVKLVGAGVPVFLWQKKRGFCFRTLFKIIELVAIEKINVLHSHDLGALIYGVIASLFFLRKLKVVHTQHSFVHFKKNIPRYMTYEKLFSRFAHVVCSVSDNVDEKYKSLGVPEIKRCVVKNGIDFPEYYLSKEEARKQLIDHYALLNSPVSSALEREGRILLALGRVAPGKGVDTVIRAWFGLAEAGREGWRLFIVGPHSDNTYLESVSAMIPLGDRTVVCVGRSQHPYLFYFAADAFVSLSDEEGMPLAACEAIGCGLPALLSDIPGHQSLSSRATLLKSNTCSGRADATNQLKDFLQQVSPRTDRRLIWNRLTVFRRENSFEGMLNSYVQKYLSLIQSFVIVLLGSFFGVQIDARAAGQELTSVIERPEYLKAEDWQEHIKLVLSRSEKALLIMKSNSACGPLPEISDNLKSAGLKIVWFGGVEVPVAKPSFEGAQLHAYVDGLVPLSEPVPCSQPAESRFGWLVGEIEASRNAAVGRFIGFVESSMQDSEPRVSPANKRWMLSIQVLPYVIPEKFGLALRAEFTPFFASLAHYGRSGREEGELTRRYIRSMYEHRVLPLKSWIKHPFLSEAERNTSNFFLSRYPSQELSFLSTVLKVLPEWVPVDLPRIDSSNSDDRFSYWKRWQNFIHSESTDTQENETIIRFRNSPFVYLWDEPLQEQLSLVNQVAIDLNAAAPDVSALVTVYPWDSLQDTIGIFAPLLQTLVKHGKPILRQNRELWSYVSCMSHGCGSGHSSGEPDFVIERNAAYIRVWAWMAEEYELRSILYYSVNNFWRKSKTIDPWLNLFDFTGNGDGTLFYPGRPGMFGLQEHTPVPSLRLKFWQQSSFDFEYIRHAKAVDSVCLKDVKTKYSLVLDGLSWSREPRSYQLARDALIDCLWGPVETSTRER